MKQSCYQYKVRTWIAKGLTVAMLLTPSWVQADDPTVPVPNPVKQADEQIEFTAFTDMKGHYAEKAVTHLQELHLINGGGDQRFRPSELITRQDFAVLLAKVTGLQTNRKGDIQFSDVPANSPYAPFLQSLVDAGIIKGKGDRFDATAPLTREDLAVILARAMDITANTAIADNQQKISYTDAQAVDAYAREAVSTIAEKGWLVGSKGMFYPQNKVTRAEAAVVAERILQARRDQAERGEYVASVDSLTAVSGTSQQIEVKRKDGGKLPFTPIYSIDHPELGRILPDGTFIAGLVPGKGQISVTVGYQTLSVPVEVTANGTATEPASVDTTPSDSPAASGDQMNYAPNSFTSVSYTGPQDRFFGELEKKYPGPTGGIVTPTETWTGYNRQFGREITVQLPEKKHVERVALTFKQDQKAGIVLPKMMEVEVSPDGKRWSYAGKVTHAVSPSDTTPTVRALTVSLPDTEIQAVRVRFPVKVWVFARELQVWGSNSEHASLFTLLPPVRETAQRMEDRKAEDRMENVLLAYSGANGERGSWRSEDFLPLVGYINPEGKVVDRMFDTVLFLPYPTMPTTKGGWEYYLRDVFRPGRQLDALNDAMREYNKRRGTLVNNPTVEKVILTLPYPSANQRDFGKIDEDQDTLTFQAAMVGEEKAYQYRKQAMEWYFNQLMDRWNHSEFAYLKLEGVYWFHELVEEAAPKERELIWDAAEMVHEKALRFYWIPYYEAPGFMEWKQLGFDYAFVQPNFYNTYDIAVDRIESTLTVTDKYGMGIEVEGDERMVRDLKFYQLYYNQLIAGHKLGIDKNKVHAYYYGSKSLLEAYYNKEPHFRALYDDTYKWMRGKFTITDYMKPIQVQTP